MINLEEYLRQIVTEDYLREDISPRIFHLADTIIKYASYEIVTQFYSYYELFRVEEISEEELINIFYMYE